jgi:hypothetical protein
MSCGDRKADFRADGEVDGRGNDGAAHSKHEKGGVVGEGIDLNNLGTDGIRNTVSYTDTERY